jgi:predicted anti-sigma-YlaC factor YlaD
MTTADDLRCQEIVEIVTDYLEGTLSPAMRARFEEHLAGCSGCRNYLEQMRTTISLVGNATETSLSDSTKSELLRVFRDWKADQQ